MKYVVESSKTVEQVSIALEAAVTRNSFGVLHVHDLQQTLKNKGVDFPHACRIFEICNPQIANRVLTQDMSLNMALPCRISVYEEGGRTKIGMISPEAMLSMLSNASELKSVAAEVEAIAIRIIDEAK